MQLGIVEADEPLIRIVCNNFDGTPLNLVDCSVLFRFKSAGGTVEERDITSSIEGSSVSYRFEDDEMMAGRIQYEVKITDGDGHPFTQREIGTLIVRKVLT